MGGCLEETNTSRNLRTRIRKKQLLTSQIKSDRVSGEYGQVQP